MTRDEAEQLNAQIIRYIEECSCSMEIGTDLAINVMDYYLEVIPEMPKKEIVFLGKNARTIKPGNIKIDLKGLIIAAIELAASIGIPNTLFELIQLGLQSCIFVFKVIDIEIGKEEAELVYVLYEIGAYQKRVEEPRIKAELLEMMKSSRIENFDMDKYDMLVNNLLKIQVIDMENNRIMLKEKVWGNK